MSMISVARGIGAVVGGGLMVGAVNYGRPKEVGKQRHQSGAVAIYVENGPPPQKGGGIVTAGGVAALFQCEHLLRQDETTHVYYIDGPVKDRSQKSGDQLHPHPSMWTFLNMVGETAVWSRSNGLLAEKKPDDPSYKPRHYPINSWDDVKRQLLFGAAYIKIKLNPSFEQLERDRVQSVRESLETYKAIDSRIRSEGGPSIADFNGRIYYESDKDTLDDLQKTLTTVGVRSKVLLPEALQKRSIIKTGNLHGLHLLDDGCMLPDFKTIVLDSLKENSRFHHIKDATLNEIIVTDTDCGQLRRIKGHTPEGPFSIEGPDKCYLSVGHDQVYFQGKKLFQLTPIAGVSMDVRCRFSVDRLKEQLGETCTETLVEKLKGGALVPLANEQRNIHITPDRRSVTHKGEDIEIEFRLTSGGNFNRYTYHPSDKESLIHEVQQYMPYDELEVLRCESCDRQSGPENFPSTLELGKKGEPSVIEIYKGGSGVGLSHSGSAFTQKPEG